MSAPTIEVRRAADRFATRAGWLETRHSFSIGRHYDPTNTHHGLLLVNSDARIQPGTGFDTHPHRDMEIITWVLDGELEHRDTLGNEGLLYPGLAQRMTAGTGIWHSEKNPSPAEAVHLIQMWVRPDTEAVEPSYQQLDINTDLDRGGLIPIASGQGHEAALSIRQRDAVLWAGRLKAGETVAVPNAVHTHLFIAGGTADLEGGGGLVEGDAARLSSAGGPQLTAGPAGAEVLIWETA